jgi:hypothetical protein
LLFKPTDTTSKAETAKPALTEPIAIGSAFSVMGKKADVLNAIDSIQHLHTLHFCTQGRWSAHELLAKILQLTGSAEVCLTSWALTEEPVRMLVQMQQQNIITEMFLVTDKRIKVHNPNAYQLAVANFPNMLLADIHAKVMTIVNDKYKVNVVTSANFTKNKRFEAGVISECPVSTEFHRQWIKKIISDGMD